MVAIKNMEMPSCCIWDCPLAREDGGDCQLVDIKTSDKERPKDCPLVEIEERKVGKWIELKDFDCSDRGEYLVECSICGSCNGYDKSNYCPNCGTEMRGVENENN